MKETEKTESDRNIQDRSWDLLAEMWLTQEADEITKELEADKAAGQTSEMDAFFARYDAKNLQNIERNAKKHKTQHFIHKTLPRVAKVAAIIIVAVFIAGGTAVAASPMICRYLVKLLIQVTPEYTSLQFVEDTETEAVIPGAWAGNYYPTILPDNLSLIQVENSTAMHTAYYVGDDEQKFEFSEAVDGTINVDSENAASTPISIGESEGVLLEKGDQVIIYWYDNTTLFTITAFGYDRSEVLLSANSVRKK